MTAPLRQRDYREYIRERTEISPRVRRAILLYQSGAVKSKKEAARLAGIHPQYMYMVTTMNPAVQGLMKSLDEQITDESVNESVLLQKLAREALLTSHKLLHNGKDEVRARVAADILDRNASTQKTQRLQVDTFSLSSEDAKEIARALVKSSEAKAKYAEPAELVEVSIDGRPELKVIDGGAGSS